MPPSQVGILADGQMRKRQTDSAAVADLVLAVWPNSGTAAVVGSGQAMPCVNASARTMTTQMLEVGGRAGQ